MKRIQSAFHRIEWKIKAFISSIEISKTPTKIKKPKIGLNQMSFQKLNQQKRVFTTCVTTTLVTSINNLQQINQTTTKIQVHPVAGNNSSKERLRNKIAESQNKRRLRVNWSALRD